jgi:uncharacterized membrane protein
MHTSVLVKFIYSNERKEWVSGETSSVGVVEQVELTISLLVGLVLLITIFVIFVSHLSLTLEVGVGLVYIYSLTSLLVSNEYLLSDWHTKTD